jgi:hypothetical protein
MSFLLPPFLLPFFSQVGQDGDNIGFIDIWWDAKGIMQKRVTMTPCGEFEEEGECKKFIDEKVHVNRLIGYLEGRRKVFWMFVGCVRQCTDLYSVFAV